MLHARARCYSKFYTTSRAPIVHIPKANVFRFGDPNTAAPIFRSLQWTVHEGDAWAVIGSGSGEKAMLFRTLLGHLRISPAPPPPGGLFPFLSTSSTEDIRTSTSTSDPYSHIALVSFSHRPRTSGGGFYDFTARYGAVRDLDRLTLRQSMFPETVPPEFPELELPRDENAKEMSELEKQVFGALVDRMGLRELLDLPLVALSNGQTRRARIVKAILRKPELLLLDEPLTGLDVQSRPRLLEVLRALHTARAPRVVLGLRTQDPVPEWVTHVAFVNNGRVVAGPKEEVLPAVEHIVATASTKEAPVVRASERGELLVDMKGINVKYGTRTVLKDINWQIRQGERWHLQGTNGSGKTTLLALLTGAHPQSYTQPHLHLHGRPRPRLPTPYLQSLVALFSPELFDAFPRRTGMRVWDAVATGFDGGFVPLGRGKEAVGVGVMRPLSEEEVAWRMWRCWAVLEALGPGAWGGDADGTGVDTKAFAERAFVDLPVGEQRMVLLMRALVGRAPLVLLDEVWSGMGEGMVRAARQYLRSGEGVGPEQAVVVITHWEEEVPWTVTEGVRRFRLDGGFGMVVD
ncbi:hypothetical protein D9615_004509 [Tricholomella constricta]|uniref:ABC transporter domain-containing protein n=1 Tax=Tricholomella constricta TaxID=117010 RepID=A0A8H5HBA7_9AGAR|nr:hypothetical protein D9615_004509 [Tricholomella constricta]